MPTANPTGDRCRRPAGSGPARPAAADLRGVGPGGAVHPGPGGAAIRSTKPRASGPTPSAPSSTDRGTGNRILGPCGCFSSRSAAAPLLCPGSSCRGSSTGRLGHKIMAIGADQAGGHHVVRGHQLVASAVDQPVVDGGGGTSEQRRRHVVGDGQSGVPHVSREHRRERRGDRAPAAGRTGGRALRTR